jgi:hypothetical protein
VGNNSLGGEEGESFDFLQLDLIRGAALMLLMQVRVSKSPKPVRPSRHGHKVCCLLESGGPFDRLQFEDVSS